LIVVDDKRMPLLPGERPLMKLVRLRTIGCYPLTGAIESAARSIADIVQEALTTRTRSAKRA
jgi:sulfate adenylyltransferase subunit 2